MLGLLLPRNNGCFRPPIAVGVPKLCVHCRLVTLKIFRYAIVFIQFKYKNIILEILKVICDWDFNALVESLALLRYGISLIEVTESNKLTKFKDNTVEDLHYVKAAR